MVVFFFAADLGISLISIEETKRIRAEQERKQGLSSGPSSVAASLGPIAVSPGFGGGPAQADRQIGNQGGN